MVKTAAVLPAAPHTGDVRRAEPSGLTAGASIFMPDARVALLAGPGHRGGDDRNGPPPCIVCHGSNLPILRSEIQARRETESKYGVFCATTNVKKDEINRAVINLGREQNRSIFSENPIRLHFRAHLIAAIPILSRCNVCHNIDIGLRSPTRIKSE